METQQLLLSIQQEIAQIKRTLLSPTFNSPVSEKWVSRTEAMHFFGYAATQMASLEKSGELIVAKIGKRKFILKESITRLLDKNAQHLLSPNKAGQQ